jgi:hypothetical protein
MNIERKFFRIFAFKKIKDFLQNFCESRIDADILQKFFENSVNAENLLKFCGCRKSEEIMWFQKICRNS